MEIKTNPVGTTINQFIMRAALPLGGYFIVEYLIRNYSATHLFLGFLTIPMMIVTPFLLFFTLRRLRDRVLGGKITGFMAWTFGVQLMLFAGILEASFIYVFNEFIVPTNLVDVRNQMLEQYEYVLTQVQALPNNTGMIATMTDTMQQTLEMLNESPVASAIETAISMLSNDVFFGMIIMAIVAPIVRKS